MPFLSPESGDYEKSLAILGRGLADTIFGPFARKRQPRPSALVKAARAQGYVRVAAGEEAAMARDNALRAGFRDTDALMAKFDGLLREPFQNL